MSQHIALAQNDDAHLRLLRAAAVMHGRVAIVDRVRWILAVAVGAGAVLSFFFTQALIPALVAAVAYSVFGELAAVAIIRRFNTRAALIQQVFDISLFELDWTLAEDRPSDQETALLASRFRGTSGDLTNWYVDVTGMPARIARVVCQRQNLLWDSDLRQDWTLRLVAGIASYLSLAFVVSLLAGWTVANMTKWWIAPALPLLVAAVSSVLQHRESIADRRKILHTLNVALERAGRDPDANNVLRGISATAQDAIFATRRRSPRVAEWFYRKRKAQYELAFVVETEALRAQWVRAR